jgi:2,3-bisphosphoglycerate-independent phosphoglycerate mutase
MLQKSSSFSGVQGPVVVIVMDGYGLPKSDVGSAIAAAQKPNLDRLFATCPNIRLRAHGTAVGMPSDDDMGNSEVGHNAIGAGQVYSQGAALVADAIACGAIWQGEAWQQIVAGVKAGAQSKAGVMHFSGAVFGWQRA